MNRQPKAHFNALAQINADTTLIPQTERTTVWAGEHVHLKIAVSHVGHQTIDGLTLVVLQGGANNRQRTHTDQPLFVSIPIDAPQLEQPADVIYQLDLRTKRGDTIAYREFRLSVYPEIQPAVSIWTPSGRLAAWLESLGYPLAKTASDANLILADQLKPKLTKLIQSGCRVGKLGFHGSMD